MELLAGLVLGLLLAGVFARQVAGRGPPLWAFFGAGALATVALGLLPVAAAAQAIWSAGSVLWLLFALFVFARALEDAGALDHLARWVLGRASRAEDVPMFLFVGFAVLATFLLNDALVLVGVPVLLAVARRLRTDPAPLLFTLAFSVTVGSVLTPLGNPQNLLVSLASGIHAPIVTFLRFLFVPTAINIGLGAWWIRRSYGRPPAGAPPPGPAAPRIPLLPARPVGALVRRAPVLVLFPASMVLLLGLDGLAAVSGAAEPPLYLIALGGALATLAASPRPARILRRVDWAILALFAGLFVVVAGAAAGGVIGALESVVPIPRPGAPVPTIGALILSSFGGSQLVSNVPWVGLQISVLHGLGYGAGTPRVWVALAAGSTLAGNLSFLGAASNLIVVEEAERSGVRLSLRAFVRTGAPLAAMTAAVLFACLAVGV